MRTNTYNSCVTELSNSRGIRSITKSRPDHHREGDVDSTYSNSAGNRKVLMETPELGMIDIDVDNMRSGSISKTPGESFRDLDTPFGGAVRLKTHPEGIIKKYDFTTSFKSKKQAIIKKKNRSILIPLGREKFKERREALCQSVSKKIPISNDYYYVYGTKIITQQEALVLESQGKTVLKLLRTRGGAKMRKGMSSHDKKKLEYDQEKKNKERLKSKSKQAKKKDKRTRDYKNTVIIVKTRPNTPEPKVRVEPAPQKVPPPLPEEYPVVERINCDLPIVHIENYFPNLELLNAKKPVEVEVVDIFPGKPEAVVDPPADVPEEPVPSKWHFEPPKKPEPVAGIDLTMFEFTYETHDRLFLFFTYRKIVKEYLPKPVVLELYPLIRRPNAVELMSWEDTLSNNPIVQRYFRYYLSSSVDEAVSFWTKCIALWYSGAKQKADKGYMLSRANSKYVEARRLQSNNLSKTYNVTMDGYRRIGEYYWKSLLLAATCVSTAYLLRVIRARREEEKPIKHQMLPYFSNLSIYLEECIKCVPIVGWRFVTLVERLQNGNWKTYAWHKKSMNWSYSMRIRKHKLINGPVNEMKLQYQYFVEKGKLSVHEGVEELNSWNMPARKLPRVVDHKVRDYATIDHPDHIIDYHDYPDWYAFMWCVSPLVKPANSYENQKACVEERVNAYENTVTEQAQQDKILEVAKQITLDHIEDPHFRENLRPEQRKNLESAESDIIKGIKNKTIVANIKGDELINGKDKSVPRFLCNLSGYEYLVMGKITSEITHWLATSSWNYKGEGLLKLGKYQLIPYLTCGATSNLLDAFVENALSSHVGLWQMLMGDDTLLINRYDNTVLENDFSRYDRTQNDFLLSVPNKILERNGYAELVTHRKEQYLKPVAFQKHRKTRKQIPKPKAKDGKKPQMRMTGEAATCLDNSINNALCTLVAIESGLPIVEGYARCGLVAKAHIYDTVSGATFLKGVFLIGEDGKYHWIRLPSWICKFGKVLTDPCLIYPKDDINTISKKLIWSQFLGYGYMRTNWFYDAIADQIERITGKPVVVKDNLEFWQVEQSKVRISKETWDDFMLKRYGITEDIMLSYIEVLKQIQPEQLPVIYHHNMALTLLDKDY